MKTRRRPPPARHLALVVLAAGLAATACDRSPSSEDPFPNRAAPTSVAPVSPRPPAPDEPSPTPPAVPQGALPSRGAPGPGCVEGWVRPEEGTAAFTDPIGLIRTVSPFAGPYVVVDMREFVGPESPPSDKGYLKEVRRWYVKLYAAEDLSYQGRFLVEQRTFGRGVVAVAPYDTEGFSSPDWVGFQLDGSDPARRAYEGLPGRWRGVPYDFVNGGAGLTIPGLPDDVRGCLDGT